MSVELTTDTLCDWADQRFTYPSELLNEIWELDQDVYWDIYTLLEKKDAEGEE